MPFNPDEYLASKKDPQPAANAGSNFDPDTYLKSKGAMAVDNTANDQAKEDISKLTAFGSHLQNAALFGFGDRAQAAAQSGMQFSGPEYDKNLQSTRDQLAQGSKDFPLQAGAGTVLGLGVSGIAGGELADVAGNAVSKMSSNVVDRGIGGLALKAIESAQGPEAAQAAAKLASGDFFSNLPKTLTEIGMLANEGGVNSIGLNQADDFKSAVDAYKNGASITGLLGVGAKGAGAGFSAFSEAPVASSIKSAYKYGKESGDYVLNNAPQIAARVENLPDYTQSVLNKQIQQLGKLKGDRIAKLASNGVEVPIQAPLTSFYDKLTALEKMPGEKDAAETAKAIVSQYEDMITKGGKNKQINIQDLDNMKQSLQDSWTKGGTMAKYYDTSAFRAFKGLEKDLRDSISAVDPKIGAWNDLNYNFRNALEDTPNLTKYEAKAMNPDKPSTISEWRDFNRHFQPNDTNKGSYNDRYFGLKSDTLKDPEAASILSKTKDLIDMEVQPSLQDFYVLNKVKSSDTAPTFRKFLDILPTPTSTANRLGQIANKGKYFTETQKDVVGSFLKGLRRGAATQGPSMLGLTDPNAATPLVMDPNAQTGLQDLGK